MHDVAFDPKAHWEGVYGSKASDRVSWFQETAAPSLAMIEASGVSTGARIVDVGGGASRLAGELLARGFDRLTVLDIASKALEIARGALEPEAAAKVDWVAQDILDWRPAGRFDLWHDRAVFHFLTEPEDQARYLEVMRGALEPSGWLVLAAFAPEGPERCSDRPVRRWSVEGLAAVLGPEFSLERSFEEAHRTPWDAVQAFTWTLFRRQGPAG